MKHFVYFDKDFINSYLSQIDGGLITSLQEEVNDWLEQGQIETIVPEHMSREVGFSLIQLLSLKFKITDETLKTSNSTKQTQVAKEFINKVIHDDSYDKLIKDLEEKDLLKNSVHGNHFDTGDYIYINDNVDIVDLSHIINIFDSDFEDIYQEVGRIGLKEELSVTNREQRKDKDFKKAIQQAEKGIDEDLKDIKFGTKMIRLMSKMLPSNIFIIYENFLIPLNKSFFREDSNSIRFKYTEKAHIVGRLTGNIKDIIKRDGVGEFSEVLNSLDEVALTMLDIVLPNKDLKILYPISLYFE